MGFDMGFDMGFGRVVASLIVVRPADRQAVRRPEAAVWGARYEGSEICEETQI